MKKSKLISLRESLGLTRYRVAKDTGIHYETLSRLENLDYPTVRREHLRTLQNYYVEAGVQEQLTLDVILA